MTADYEMRIIIKGTTNELKAMLKIIGFYQGDRPQSFSSVRINGKEIGFNSITDNVVTELETSGKVNVTALGPWGHYGELNDVGIFREMAEAAPQASFSAEISGYGQYDVQNLKCELKEGLLYITTFIELNDEEDEAWKESFIRKLPPEKFKELFKISCEDFDEAAYEDILNEINAACYDSFENLELADLLCILPDIDAETELDDDGFLKIMKKIDWFSSFGIVTPQEFNEDFDGGVTNEYIYNPITKSYLGKNKPIHTLQVTSANETISVGLKAQGLPSDDDTIANLSFEDAVKAFAMGIEENNISDDSSYSAGTSTNLKEGSFEQGNMSNENVKYIYTCQKCSKAYKAIGSNKRIKCKDCDIFLTFTNITDAEWNTYDKNQKNNVFKAQRDEDTYRNKDKMLNKFQGKNFVLSGFDSFNEPPLREVIEKNGGVVRSSTVLDTDYLIYDERFGVGTKKYERARELNETKGKNIKIIPYNEFMRMIMQIKQSGDSGLNNTPVERFEYSTYICKQCKKVFKAKRDSRVKCSSCEEQFLTDMNIDFEQWKNLDKDKRDGIVHRTLNIVDKNNKEQNSEKVEISNATIQDTLDDAEYMYICKKCKKVFKVKGRDKKIKCSNCKNILNDTGITEDVWKAYNKDQKELLFEDSSSTIPNFFLDIDTLNCIMDMELKDNYKDIDLTVDIIDIPFYLIYTSDADSRTARAIKRLQMYSHDGNGFEAGSAVARKEDGNISVSATEALSDNIPVLYMACRGICQYIIDNNLQLVYAGFDPEEKGIMLTEKDGKIAYKVVSGRQRPNMECYTLFNDIEMSRPYSDEIFEADEVETMSFNEKEQAAEDGNVYAMKEVALAYLNGDEVDQNPQKAAFWMEKAAENDDLEAQYNIGLFYAKGHGVNRDYKKAAEWMLKAYENGDPDAKEPSEKYGKIIDDLAKAKAGDAQAQADVASTLMSLGGSLDQAGTGNDYKESLFWAEKSAAQGNGDGLWNLALAYEHGRGVRKNIKKAIEYYGKGVDVGNAKCQHNLAICYLRGDVEGYAENSKKGQEIAFGLLLKSAEQGYGLAMRDVGRCYQFATGTTGNMKKAVEWYEKACEVLDDPELRAKTEHFKMLADLDDFDKDYPQSGDNDEDSSDDISDAFVVIAELDGYERKLAKEGILPGEPIEDGKFRRVHEKAKEGDKRAKDLLARFDSIEGDKGEAALDFLKEIDSCESNEEKNVENLKDDSQGSHEIIKQIATLPDGSKKEIAVWGGYELDGFDRTLNIFMKLEDIGEYIEYAEMDVSEIKDPCENDKGWQMTADLLDNAVTCIFRKDGRRFILESYIRDEKKSYSMALENLTGELDLDEDKDYDSEKRTFVSFALSLLGLRNYLLKEGVVKELYDMYDESAGVIVMAKNGAISTKIVRGAERPDLICHWLLGEEMCRPYIDERIGLKSDGIRKPYDPKMKEKINMAANNSKPTVSEPKVDADKEIKAKIRAIKSDRAKADKQFEEGVDILRNPGVSMDYDNYIDVATRLFRMSDSISRAQYNSLQNLVQELDGFCRNMLKHNPSSSVIREVYDLIKDMNESSEVEINLNIEFEGMKLNNPSQSEFKPSARCKEIERFWRNESSKSTPSSTANAVNSRTNSMEKTTGRSSFFDTVPNKSASDLNDKDKEILAALKASSTPMTISEIHKALGEKDSFQLLTAKLKQLKDKEIVTSYMEGRIMKWSIKR